MPAEGKGDQGAAHHQRLVRGGDLQVTGEPGSGR
jgi:hypothetical protein